MTDTEATPFAAHAIVELMGHVRLAGWATETTLAGAGCIRVDVPDETGTTKATKYCFPASIYAVTPCDEETARRTANPYTWRQTPELEAGDQDDDEDDTSWQADEIRAAAEPDEDLDYDEGPF